MQYALSQIFQFLLIKSIFLNNTYWNFMEPEYRYVTWVFLAEKQTNFKIIIEENYVL